MVEISFVFFLSEGSLFLLSSSFFFFLSFLSFFSFFLSC